MNEIVKSILALALTLSAQQTQAAITPPECWDLMGMVPGLFIVESSPQRAQILKAQLETHSQFEKPIQYLDRGTSRQLYIQVKNTAVPAHASMHLNRYIGMAAFDEIHSIRCSRQTFEQARRLTL